MEENKNNKGLIVLIIILIIMVLGLGGYIVYDKIISNKSTETNENNKQPNETNEEEQQKTYKSYKIGDTVALLDSSQWNVLKDSNEDEEFVTLLSVDNINKEYKITFTDAPTYVSTTYKSNLLSSLDANNTNIKESRLLTLEDISKLSGIDVSKLIPGESLENNITPAFLYQSETITSSVDQNIPIMVCNAVPEDYETNPGRICEGTQTFVFPIRPVIVISKRLIK